jgi:hypothetical protein
MGIIILSIGYQRKIEIYDVMLDGVRMCTHIDGLCERGVKRKPASPF